MASLNFRAGRMPRILLPLLACALFAATARNGLQAAESFATHAYVVPADEGYGLTECLTSGGECARVVADAWCESHGHAQSVSLGKADDVTGALVVANYAAAGVRSDEDLPAAASYVVTCGE